MIATFFFFFNDTATTEIYTLSLHDALPICNRSQVTRKAKELWTLTRLRAGDKVVANRGTSEVLAIGTVKDPAYEWRPERDEYRHTVAVDWEDRKSVV